MSHEIECVAEAETVLVSEGNMSDAAIARHHRSAGVEEHITCRRKALEPRKPHRVLQMVTGGSTEQGETGALCYTGLGWRTEV
ncbi:MAG: hypothetical protein ABIJ00_05515 [Candidatus Eisenbacteria bacterium]